MFNNFVHTTKSFVKTNPVTTTFAVAAFSADLAFKTRKLPVRKKIALYLTSAAVSNVAFWIDNRYFGGYEKFIDGEILKNW